MKSRRRIRIAIGPSRAGGYGGQQYHVLDHVICGYLTLGIMTRPISVSEIRSASIQSSDIGGARRCAECRPPVSPPAAHAPQAATSPCRVIISSEKCHFQT